MSRTSGSRWAWGVKRGDYLVLPFLGPTTQRDVWAVPVGVVTDPLTWVGEWWQTMPVDVVRALDFRASAENTIHFRDAAAIDPYVFTRQAFLQYRQNKLEGGGGPVSTQPAMDYFENEPETPETPKSPESPESPQTQPTRPPQTQPATGPATKPGAR